MSVDFMRLGPPKPKPGPNIQNLPKKRVTKQTKDEWVHETLNRLINIPWTGVVQQGNTTIAVSENPSGQYEIRVSENGGEFGPPTEAPNDAIRGTRYTFGADPGADEDYYSDELQ